MISDLSNLKDPARRTKNDGGQAGRDPQAGGVTSCSPSATQVYRQVVWVSSESRADRLYLPLSFTPELQDSQLSK